MNRRSDAIRSRYGADIVTLSNSRRRDPRVRQTPHPQQIRQIAGVALIFSELNLILIVEFVFYCVRTDFGCQRGRWCVRRCR